MASQDDAPWVHAETVGEWRAWLRENHEQAGGAWLVFWRPGTARPRIAYDDAILEALCVGWIDGQAKPIDDERTMLWFVPRNPRSSWSRVNKERVSLLERDGRLLPAGRRAIEAAKLSGTWSVLDDADNLVLPTELVDALDARPSAREHWDGYPPSARRAILSWIALAKRPETRQRRILAAADNAARGERPESTMSPG
jgi:uncharacterized protein YdeI (YjbR/CyaY-like superfamily)